MGTGEEGMAHLRAPSRGTPAIQLFESFSLSQGRGGILQSGRRVFCLHPHSSWCRAGGAPDVWDAVLTSGR